jgi:hypothetical protein
LCIGNCIRAPRSRHPPQNLAVNRISENASEAFDLRSRFLIDWTPLNGGRSRPGLSIYPAVASFCWQGQAMVAIGLDTVAWDISLLDQ